MCFLQIPLPVDLVLLVVLLMAEFVQRANFSTQDSPKK